jgi:ATP-dependent RNA helicase DeaD
MKSESLRLSKAMIALLEQHGITEPTPIQKEIIPAIIDGQDVIAQSETGSGKTLSFAIPIIERLTRRDGLRVLVVVPTRELAVQITGEFIKFSHGKHLGVTAIYGGVSIGEQARKLSRTNIVVGTPGRLLDMMERGLLKLDTIQALVLDEADRMLDMGFIKDIEKIVHKVPAERQTLLFSATLAKEVVTLSRKFLRNPKHVQLASTVQPHLLHQTYYQTSAEKKLPLLLHLLKSERDLALVFCNRKHITAKVARQLTKLGINARPLNGDMTQGQRERTTAEFRQKRFNVLVATDVAARGLHIDDVSHVYNYEIPKDVDSYTHRVGRTARAGNKGHAISLVASGEEKQFFQKILFDYRGSIVLKTADNVPIPQELLDVLKPTTQRTGAEQSKRREYGEKKSAPFGNRTERATPHSQRGGERSERRKPVSQGDTRGVDNRTAAEQRGGKPPFWEKHFAKRPWKKRASR